MKTNINKYRPVLSAPLILHILNLAKKENPISNESMQIIGVLAPFSAKIENAAITAAYSTTPKETLLESLGELPTTSISETSISKEEYWEQSYNLYITDPTACSLEQILAAKEHMYLNELMTTDEVIEFEASL